MYCFTLFPVLILAKANLRWVDKEPFITHLNSPALESKEGLSSSIYSQLKVFCARDLQSSVKSIYMVLITKDPWKRILAGGFPFSSFKRFQQQTSQLQIFHQNSHHMIQNFSWKQDYSKAFWKKADSIDDWGQQEALAPSWDTVFIIGLLENLSFNLKGNLHAIYY